MNSNPIKLKASTIIETLVASVIIILIFTIASLTLNNIFKGTIKNNTSKIDNHLVKLIYLQQNKKIETHFQEDYNQWGITIQRETKNKISYIMMEATNKETKKTIHKLSIDVDH